MTDKTLYDKDSIQSLSPLEDEVYGYVYSICNTLNNKRYIGSTTKTPEVRFRQHKNRAFSSSHKQYYPLYCAFRKYGINNFSLEILYEGLFQNQSELRKLERQYIISECTLIPNGYNQTDYTEQPSKGESIRSKISKTKRDRARNVVEYTEDYQIVEQWNSIRDCAEELHLNEIHIADCCNGRRHTTGNKRFCWLKENGELNIPQYIGFKYKGAYGGDTRPLPTSKTIQQIDLETGNIIAEYRTAALAARTVNGDSSKIIAVCKHKRYTHKGYGWRYKNEEA